MSKFIALFDVFRKGSMVANPELWKNGGAALQAAIAAFIVSAIAAAKGLGYELPISTDAAMAIAGGISAVAGVVVTFVSSDKVGLAARVEPSAVAGAPGGEPAGGGIERPPAVGGWPADREPPRDLRAGGQADQAAGMADNGGP